MVYDSIKEQGVIKVRGKREPRGRTKGQEGTRPKPFPVEGADSFNAHLSRWFSMPRYLQGRGTVRLGEGRSGPLNSGGVHGEVRDRKRTFSHGQDAMSTWSGKDVALAGPILVVSTIFLVLSVIIVRWRRRVMQRRHQMRHLLQQQTQSLQNGEEQAHLAASEQGRRAHSLDVEKRERILRLDNLKASKCLHDRRAETARDALVKEEIVNTRQLEAVQADARTIAVEIDVSATKTQQEMEDDISNETATATPAVSTSKEKQRRMVAAMKLTERTMPTPPPKGRLAGEACSSHSGDMGGKGGEGKTDWSGGKPMEEGSGETVEGYGARGGVMDEAKNAKPGQLKFLFQQNVIGQASKVIQAVAREIQDGLEDDAFFREEECLGSGLCGEVRVVRPYEGAEEGWVVKMLKKEYTDRLDADSMFAARCARQEMVAFYRMGYNDNIVKAWAMDDDQPSKPIVMEMADADLLGILDEGYTVQDFIAIAYNVACGLLHMHLCGLVHCDVKPENILVFFMADDTMKAKVSDFGLTLAIGERREAGIGTLGFAPPENFEHAVKAHPNQDSYSMGCLLFMLLVRYDLMEVNIFCAKEMLEEDEKQRLEHIPVKGSDGLTPRARVDIEAKATMRNARNGKFEREMLKVENLDEDVPHKAKVIAFVKKLLCANPDERPTMSVVVHFLRDLRDSPDGGDTREESYDEASSGDDEGTTVHELYSDLRNLFDCSLP